MGERLIQQVANLPKPQRAVRVRVAPLPPSSERWASLAYAGSPENYYAFGHRGFKSLSLRQISGRGTMAVLMPWEHAHAGSIPAAQTIFIYASFFRCSEIVNSP